MPYAKCKSKSPAFHRGKLLPVRGDFALRAARGGSVVVLPDGLLRIRPM